MPIVPALTLPHELDNGLAIITTTTTIAPPVEPATREEMENESEAEAEPGEQEARQRRHKKKAEHDEPGAGDAPPPLPHHQDDLAPEASGASCDSDSSSDSDAGSGSDSDDDDSEDDEAELSPERAAEIAAETAALRIVHSVPPRRVRGILATQNIATGLSRTLSTSVMAQRRKGLRWNMTEGAWTERAGAAPATPRAPPTASNQSNANGRPVTPGTLTTATTAAGTKHATAAAATTAAEAGARRPSFTEGEGNALHKSQPQGARARPTPLQPVDHSHSLLHCTPIPASPLTPTSVVPIHNGSSSSGGSGSGLPTAVSPFLGRGNSSSTTAAHPSPSGPPPPRQYTSSARLAGSSSFKARQNAAVDRTDSLLTLSQTVATSTNLLLRLSQAHLIALGWTALQQLFLVYSRAARNVRDRAGAWAEKEKRRGEKKRMQHQGAGEDDDDEGSHHHHHHKPSPRSASGDAGASGVAPEHGFLVAAGIIDAPTAGGGGVGVSGDGGVGGVQWLDLDASCAMSLEEMHVLALHLVQKKLDGLVQELAARPDVQSGKVKLTGALKAKRFALFPHALTAAAAEDGSPSIKPTLSSTNTASSSSLLSSTSSLHSSTAQMEESQITERFVKCTIRTMQEKIGKNNFGELTWGPMMDHWRRFASYYFLYRADTNPDGVAPTLPADHHAAGGATPGRKANAAGGATSNAASTACAVM